MGALNTALEGASDAIGVQAAGLKFLLTLLFSLPVCFTLKQVLGGQPAPVKHIAFSLAGLALSYFNYGNDTIHFIITIFVNFTLLRLAGGSGVSVVLSFIFNMGYLLTAYVYVSTDDYDIIWTTPQCIMTLRMIGVAFDLYDGHRPEDDLSKEQKSLFIRKAPSLLELLSATMFPGGFFAGPQFSFRMYLDFIGEKGIYKDIYGGDAPPQLGPAVKKVLFGLLLVVVYALGGPYFGADVLVSTEFETSPLLIKVLWYMGFGFHFYFKYIGFWVITEAVCIAAGLSYNGKDDSDKPKWDALEGVHVFDLLSASTFRQHITSFNLTTNLWTARYVYKRCRFLGNRHLSQAISLCFLATWHGLYPGYFLCFMLEMLFIMVEDQMLKVSDAVPALKKLKENPVSAIPLYIVMKAWMSFFWSYPITAFVLLRIDRIHNFWSQFYYIGHVIYGLLFLVISYVIMPQIRAKRKKEEKDELKKSD